MSGDPVLDSIIRKLERRCALSQAERDAILAMPYVRRILQPSAYLVREGEKPRPHCSFVLSGFAYRQKLTSEGTREIVSLHMPGDFLDLQHLFLHQADHNVQALSRLDVADLSRDSLQELVLDHPGIGRALWIDGLVDASIYREWILNVGRRDARGRIAHVLCEFAVRMQVAGVADEGGYRLPVTQEQLGDAVGLTSVHVNRTLKALVADGFVRFDRRNLQILDWDGLRQVGEFSTLYLHLDQVAAPVEG
jgi:CRP-like cAMP-binding protein